MFHIVSPVHYARHTALIEEYKEKLLKVNDEEIPEEDPPDPLLEPEEVEIVEFNFEEDTVAYFS